MEELLNLKNVNAVGFGYKESKNKLRDAYDRLTGQECYKVFVEKKQAENKLKKADIVPKEINGIKTDVEEIGELEFLRSKERPVVGGCSGMLERWTACTLGGIVFKGKDPYIVSNEHCLDRWYDMNQVGERILQPSPFDGGKEEDAIATLVNTEHRMVLDGKTHNEFDFSMQPLHKGIPYRELFQKDIGTVTSEIAEVYPGDMVKKRGRTTGLTESNIIARDVVASVRAGILRDKLGLFKNQYFARNRNWSFVNGGDSGSLVYDIEDRCVGSLFAGSAGETGVGVISPIAPIMKAYGFTFEPTEPDDRFFYCALGRTWYVQPLGQATTLVRLNMRTAPLVSSSTLVKTVPVGTKVEVIEHVGHRGGYHWCKVKII